MDFAYSDRVKDLQKRLTDFMDAHIYPNEDLFYEQLDSQGNRFRTPQILQDIKAKAKAEGLWNLFLPHPFRDTYGVGLTNLEYAPLAEIMGRVDWASEAFNCNAPDTGNMEVFVKYATPEQQDKWLIPLLEGEIRSCFCMTEPAVASSDATNVATSMKREGDEYVINGRKWYTTGGMRESSAIFIVMGKTDTSAPKHQQQSQILVPKDTPGVKIVRHVKVYNDDHAPFGEAEVLFDNVRVPVENRLGAEGEGFKVAMQVLDRGRLHISAVCIGVAERLLADCVAYASERKQFGQAISGFQLIQGMIADSKTEALVAKAMTMETARARDAGKSVTMEAAAAKYFASEMVGRVADRAVQIFGGAGYVADHGIERFYRDVRIFRIYEGTSQIQQVVIARETMKRGG